MERQAHWQIQWWRFRNVVWRVGEVSLPISELSVSILFPKHIYWNILYYISFSSIRNDEEKIPEDELPYGHPDRPNMKSFKLEDIDVKNPESIKRASKMNKNVILLATISGNPTR